MLRVRAFLFVSLLFLLATIANPVASQEQAPGPTLVLWPIDPVIEAPNAAAALWLENRGPEPVTLQVRIAEWRITPDEDVLEFNQTGVVPSPPVATIEAGVRQLVRLVRTMPLAPGREHAYRVVIDELPAPGAWLQRQSNAMALGVTLRMRYSLPLFAYGSGLSAVRRPERSGSRRATPTLQWRVERRDDGDWLVVRNDGSGHARLSRVELLTSDARRPLGQGLLGYVLPGTERRWLLPQGLPPADAFEIAADVNGTSVIAHPVVHR